MSADGNDDRSSDAHAVLSDLARAQATSQRLMVTGIVAEGVITEVRDTGMRAASDEAELCFVLRVSGRGVKPYEVRHRQIVSRLVMDNFLAGTIVPVRIDPVDRTHILIA